MNSFYFSHTVCPSLWDIIIHVNAQPNKALVCKSMILVFLTTPVKSSVIISLSLVKAESTEDSPLNFLLRKRFIQQLSVS